MSVINDPVTFNVLSHAFRTITAEMGAVLVRSAYSPIVREAKDGATSLLDADGRVVAQSQMIPMQMNSLASAFDYLRAHFDLTAVQPDEAFVTNHPYNNGQHLNDVLLFVPAFDDGKLLGFAGTVCHHVDIGGTSALDTEATHLIQEGIVIPAMKLPLAFLTGGPFESFFTANVRAPEMFSGDFRAQVSACQRGVDLLSALSTKYGRETVLDAMHAVKDYAERMMRSRLAELPDGTYQGEDFVDSYLPEGSPLRIRVKMDVNGDDVTVDLRQCADQVPAPINSPIASTHAAVYGFFGGLMAPGTPVNDGVYRPINIITRKGSICDPVSPAPVHSRMAVCYAISGALRRAIGAQAPERVAACGDDTSTAVIFSHNDGVRHRVHVEIVGGGNGGCAERDGADGISQCLANSANMPVEALESAFDFVRVTEYALILDSGGAGAHRGGAGIRRVYEILADNVLVHTAGDGHEHPPWGLAGGENGTLSVKKWIRDGKCRNLRALSTVHARRGDILTIETSGGGGFGSPSERSQSAIRADLEQRLVSPQVAAAVYGYHGDH